MQIESKFNWNSFSFFCNFGSYRVLLYTICQDNSPPLDDKLIDLFVFAEKCHVKFEHESLPYNSS